MRILTLNYEYPPLGGGGGVAHAAIAEALAARGHRVAVLTSTFADLPRREVRAGVEILRVPVWGRRDISAASLRSLLSYPVGALAAAPRLLRRESFDIVHGHFAVPTGPASVAVARLAGAPHLQTKQGGDKKHP
jgi:glycosyltransferase involved in cell wall biosynthesis